jgi:hypothetical protein
MTLAELLPAVQQLPAVDKLRLIRLLAEELDSGEDISPLVPHKVYYLPTPYATYGAAGALLAAAKVGQSNPG